MVHPMIPLPRQESISEELNQLELDLGGAGAKVLIAQKLREMADLVDKGYPYLYGCRLPKEEDGPFVSIMVVLSHPWGG